MESKRITLHIKQLPAIYSVYQFNSRVTIFYFAKEENNTLLQVDGKIRIIYIEYLPRNRY